jgi:hypothetical protein
VHAFKRLRDQVDAQYRRCASGEALPSRCQGYVPWGELCRVRDQQPWGSIESLLLELHTHALGRSREYAAVKLFKQPPTKEQRRRHPNYCVLGRNPASSYLRLGSFKTSSYLGPQKLPLNASLHQAIITSVRQDPRKYLFEPPSKPGTAFNNANSFNHWANRRFKAVFGGRPLTSNSIRHAFANSLNLNDEAQLHHAAKRLAHTNIDTVRQLYVWQALKHVRRH